MNAIYDTKYDGASELRPLIFIVTRSLTIRKAVEICLHRTGYAVLTFANGSQVLEWIASAPPVMPSLIFLDILLEQPAAYTLLKHLRKASVTAKVPVVMLSRRDSMIERTYAFFRGAAEFLVEPFTIQQIVASVRDHAILTSKKG